MEKPGDPRHRRSQRKRTEQTVQTLIAALLLGTASGCATFDTEPQRQPQFNARPATRPVTVVTAQRGDTVETIARRYGVSPQAIADANDLGGTSRLTRGQRIVLPSSPTLGSRPAHSISVHVVDYGDTVSSIARAYDMSPGAIIDANDLMTPDHLRLGQRLKIPAAGRPARTVTRTVLPVRTVRLSAPVEDSSEASVPDPRLEGGRYYALGRPRSKPGFEGQGGSERTVPPKAAPPARSGATGDPDAAYDPNALETKAADVEPEVKSVGKFVWPVRGKVISSFGRRGSGVHNDGINIAAEPGSPVKAADGGIVVYAGNELAGYGNLLLVRHASGYVTAYAHNKKILVGRGDKVKQGQTVALVGSTGDVDRPQLHFEIRKGDRAVDPSRYLSRATASR